MAKVKIVEYIGEVMREIHFDEFEDFMEYEIRYVVERGGDVVATHDDVKHLLDVDTKVKKVLTELEIGKEYRVIGNSNGHQFEIGGLVRITERPDDDDEEYEYRAEHLDGSDYWFVVPKDLEEI